MPRSQESCEILFEPPQIRLLDESPAPPDIAEDSNQIFFFLQKCLRIREEGNGACRRRRHPPLRASKYSVRYSVRSVPDSTAISGSASCSGNAALASSRGGIRSSRP